LLARGGFAPRVNVESVPELGTKQVGNVDARGETRMIQPVQ
jgi:hypothetical protein